MSTQSARQPADGQHLLPRIPFSAEFVDHEDSLSNTWKVQVELQL